MPANLLRPLVEFDEHCDFAAQNLRHNRSKDVVHSAELIPARDVVLRLIHRRDENNRRVLRGGTLPNQRSRLEPVHSGHRNIEQDDSEFCLQQLPQGLLPGLRYHHVLVQIVQHGLKGEQFVRAIVNEKNIGLFLLLVLHFAIR